jgi:predicted AAA+ superfamily ATPase
MENVDESLRCKYCQYFYDMNKEWIDFVHKKQEKKDGIQIIKQESGKTGGRKQRSGRDSKKGD